MSILLRLIGFACGMLLAVRCDSTLSGLDLSQVNLNELQEQLPAQLANTNLTLDDFKKLFRDKCAQAAGAESGAAAYQEVENATLALGECITTIVNYTAIQAEIDEASPLGELDVVFNKYCKKRPDAVQCIETFNSKLVACLDSDEKENQQVFMRIVNSLLNFVCHKGGDQIALFIAEKGPECLESKRDDIQQCLNNTLSGYLPKEGLGSVTKLPKFVMGEKQCVELERLETCIVEKLETCSEITPANIVESMFRFIKNETVCRTSSTRMAGKLEAAKSTAARPLRAALDCSVYGMLIVLYLLVTKHLRV